MKPRSEEARAPRVDRGGRQGRGFQAEGTARANAQSGKGRTGRSRSWRKAGGRRTACAERVQGASLGQSGSHSQDSNTSAAPSLKCWPLLQGREKPEFFVGCGLTTWGTPTLLSLYCLCGLRGHSVRAPAGRRAARTGHHFRFWGRSAKLPTQHDRHSRILPQFHGIGLRPTHLSPLEPARLSFFLQTAISQPNTHQEREEEWWLRAWTRARLLAWPWNGREIGHETGHETAA